VQSAAEESQEIQQFGALHSEGEQFCAIYLLTDKDLKGYVIRQVICQGNTF